MNSSYSLNTSSLESQDNPDPYLALEAVRLEQLKRRVKKRGNTKPPSTTDREHWPPNYQAVYDWRDAHIADFTLKPQLIQGAKKYYGRPENWHRFINHWCNTYDPRKQGENKPVWMPFILFPRQEEFVHFIADLIAGQAHGLAEKSRTMGASWVALSVSVAIWLFWPQSAVGWGSQDADSVDKIGDPKSVLEKARMLIRSLPSEFLPKGFSAKDHLSYMKLVNPETGSTIVGDVGDNIGRGGRTLVYFVDEAAHLKHPEKVEASLLETTQVRIDISSVGGQGELFHRKREAGQDWYPGAKVRRDKVNVITLDWRDHPEKTQQWYEERKSKLKGEGLAHVFAREVDRDYAGAVEGVIIPAEYIEAAIDADKKLNWPDTIDDSIKMAGLDVADGGLDDNALVVREGPRLLIAQDKDGRDVGQTARWAFAECAMLGVDELDYDCIGVGAGVKSEANRLKDDQLFPIGLQLIPWMASGKLVKPYDYVITGDPESPRNKDFYQNLKAQGWWELRKRFERTFKAVMDGEVYDPLELISIPSTLPLLHKLKKELGQPIAVRSSSTLKLQVDKAPEGTKSPNLGDATMMCYWPAPRIFQPTVALAPPQFIQLSGITR